MAGFLWLLLLLDAIASLLLHSGAPLRPPSFVQRLSVILSTARAESRVSSVPLRTALTSLDASKVLCTSPPVERQRSSVYSSRSFARSFWHSRRGCSSIFCLASASFAQDSSTTFGLVSSRPFLFPVLPLPVLYWVSNHGVD